MPVIKMLSTKSHKNKNNRNITSFEEQLSLFHWRHINFNRAVNDIYDTFRKTQTDIYDANFFMREYIFKDKDIKRIKKSLRTKQNYTSDF